MRSALLSRSLTRPLSAGKGRSRRVDRVDRVLACSASGPLLTPHTRRQGYFRPRGPDTSHLGASSPFQRRSTLAFAEDSCRCRHATAPRAAKSTTSTQCLCATPFVGTVSSQSSARPATVHAQHTQHRRGRPRPWALCRPWLHRACILCMHPGTPCFVACQTPF